jgi:pimeloyl-ACP methyl ester carboxylesterase
MALDEPSAVAGLLLLSGYFYGTARPDVWPASIPAIPLVGDVMAHTVLPLIGRLIGPAAIKASFAPAPISAKIAAFPLALTLRPSQVRATAADTAMMVPSALEISRRFPELDVPLIVMAGEDDLIAHPNEHAKRFVKEVQGAELRLIPDQGHLFHYAVPDMVVTAMGDVLARIAK